MILLVRDEDVPTVAVALRTLAEERGLSADVEGEDEESGSEAFDLFSMLSATRVMLTESDAGVVIAELDSVGLPAEAWATKLSTACATEVVVFEPTASGLRVDVYDEGALDESIDVALDPSGTTRVAALTELTDSEEGARELEKGLHASNEEELLEGVLRCFDVPTESDDWLVVTFQRSNDVVEGERRLIVTTPLERLEGVVGGPLGEAHGSGFAVSLSSGDAVEGVCFEITGDALALVTIERVAATVRVRGGAGLEQRELVPDAVSDDALTFVLPDAFLESDTTGRPVIDQTDLFSTVQRLVRATETLFVNRLDLSVALRARQAGQGSLVVRATAAGNAAGPGEVAVPVVVRG